MVAQQAVSMVKRVMPQCGGELLDWITSLNEYLQMTTRDYHNITLEILPVIKLHMKELQLIHTSLQSRLCDIEATRQYFSSGKHNEEYQLVQTIH